MATTHRRPSRKKLPPPHRRTMEGFKYLTLDPSPRLRKMRETQQKTTSDPTEVVRRAWQSVGAAITEAVRGTYTRDSSQTR
jgi:hypothetical protein